MIVKWLWDAITAFLGFLLGLLPTFSPPSWLTALGTYAADGVAWANGLHMWIPLVAVRNSFIFLTAAGAAVLTVRAARIVISLFTGGGGSAA